MVEQLTGSNNIEIKKVPKLLPFKPYACAFLGKVYLSKRPWTDYLSGSPELRTLATIAHEEEHVKRSGRNIRKALRYIFDKDFRYHEELEATRAEMRVLIAGGMDRFGFLTRADDLAGPLYRWCTDAETAEKDLRDIWNSLYYHK